MLGSYRFFLALIVVFAHLAGVSNMGGYAVFGFYIISGYLMTLIMQRAYGYGFFGVCLYLLNRGLRIYPAYWVSIILTVGLIYFLGESFFKAYHRVIFMPDDFQGWFRNIFIIFPEREAPRLTPPSWALTVEIFFYILIGLGISRSATLSVFWFLISAIYHLVALYNGSSYEYRYFPVWAASLPFATGALIYHFRAEITALIERFSVFKKTSAMIFLLVMFFLNWSVSRWLGVAGGIGFYINYLLCSLALVGCVMAWPRLFSEEVDGFLGALSYPIYLVHYQIGAFVIMLFSFFDVSLERGQLIFFILTTPFIMLSAYFLVVLVERPVEVLRIKVRSCKGD